MAKADTPNAMVQVLVVEPVLHMAIRDQAVDPMRSVKARKPAEKGSPANHLAPKELAHVKKEANAAARNQEKEKRSEKLLRKREKKEKKR